MLKSRWLGIPLLAAVLRGSASLVSASIPNGNTFSRCYATLSGDLRAIDPTVTTCKTDETEIQWKRTGPAGPAGSAGLTGTNGISGYQIVTNDHSLAGICSALGTVEVDCPAGKKVLGVAGSTWTR